MANQAQVKPNSGEWTAIVLAGERPNGDPLAEELGVRAKALIEIGGKTMLARVVRALLDSSKVKQVLVLAQQIELIARSEPSDILSHPNVEVAISGNGIATSIEAVIGTSQSPWPVLVTTADNALLTPERVDDFLGEAKGCDVAVGLGERSVVEQEFPETKRTWLKFSDGHFSGANLFALGNDRCVPAVRHWQAVEQDRKKGLKLIASFGPSLLFRALTRTIGLKDGLACAGKRMGLKAKVVVLDAEAPIDVDKKEDMELVERILSQRPATLAAPVSSIRKDLPPVSGAWP
ncbi:nucleotidyltransferase family protein [Erythrobacter sp. MTPC3]|uniref:nucleotidyltransferase family protein n=1 Tax=Erythrobacter sp. MTPC3 TaxID=3056564 RepID=UPI0036F30EF9